MKIEVYKSVFVEEPHELGLVNGAISYTSKDKLELIHIYGVIMGSDLYDLFRERFSPDNGVSWSKPKLIEPLKSIHDKDGVFRCSGISLFLDEDKNVLFRFFNRGFYPHDVPKLALWHLYYQIFDRGDRKWSEPVEVKSEEAKERETFPGIREGSLAISCSFPIKTSKRKIILPAQIKAFDEYGNIWFPFKNYFSPFYESIVLIGEWRKGKVAWEKGGKVTIDPNISCRLCEPAVAELEDGRLLMICRGDNGAFPDKPGYKWVSISDDGGYNWTKPQPLTFDDGTKLFSPSSCSHLFRSWRTGKLYWIANVLKQNPVGNRPRYPLIIAEIDEDKLAVKRKSMLVIDDRMPGEPELVQLSNFRCYQDRATGDLVMIMARYGECKDDWRRSPLYLYRVHLD